MNEKKNTTGRGRGWATALGILAIAVGGADIVISDGATPGGGGPAVTAAGPGTGEAPARGYAGQPGR